MISQGLKMLKRAIDERPKGGMQTGMPKIRLRESDVARAVAELDWAQQRITELEAQLREAAKANHLSQLIGERNVFRRVSAMNVDGWLKQKMKSEINRVTCRIEEIKKDKDHE